MSDTVVALGILFGAPVLLGMLFWLIVMFEGDVDDPGRTPFDPPPWRS